VLNGAVYITEIGQLDVDDRGKISRSSSKEAKNGRITAQEWSRKQLFPQGIVKASST